ncbi:MAG: 3-phosphoglycerate kinase [Parcubacteria group bacterium Gr01-1014_44]|nr:MAG: 3-phosphoglycerate kinase [Parcubacteria group bacterium Gr01-1014_44]
MIKFLDSIPVPSLAGKKVLLRVDFNVPVKEGKLSDDFKIRAQRETINYLLVSGAKVLLVSHFDALESFSPITEEIGEILGKTVSLVPHSELNLLNVLWKTGPILLLDNIRQDKREEENSGELAQELSQGFDFFINDAFAVSHRRHALVVAVAGLLPSFGGFLMKKEIENLSQALLADAKGKVLVLGGAKISTKIPVIENFLDKAGKILIGGAVANNFFKAQGIEVGASLIDDSITIPQLGNGVSKLVLPTDILISKDKTGQSDAVVSAVRDLSNDEVIVDIGPQSAENFAAIIKNANLVIWNGPMGLSEAVQFAGGTATVAKAVAGAKWSIIGGGETIAAVAKLDLLAKFSYVSTGGGAMLEFLAGKVLPGLEALGYYK